MKKYLSPRKFVIPLCLVAACVAGQSVRAQDFDYSPTRFTANNLTVGEQSEPTSGTTDEPSVVTSFAPGQGCDACNTCDSCAPCCNCGPPGRLWIRDEYVGWFARGGFVNTLVSTSPDGTLPALTPVYGNNTYNGGFRSGNWTQAGLWFDCCKNWGLQGDYFFVGALSSPFFAQSNGDPVIGRPFIDATNGTPTQQLIAFPGVVTGSVGVDNHNSIGAWGVSLRHNVCCWNGCCNEAADPCSPDYFCNVDCCRLDVVAGYRGYQFNDAIGVREHLTSIDQTSGTAVGTTFDVNDSFHTQNTFNGGEFGVIVDRYKGRWMLEGSARAAVGNLQQVVSIAGNTAVSFPGQQTAVSQGGILALSSNIGDYTSNSLRVIPQLSGRIGYRLTPRLSFLVGYTFIYFGQVARAGDQIDTTLNPNLFPPPIAGGPSRPAFALHDSNLWLQGITIGGEYSF